MPRFRRAGVAGVVIAGLLSTTAVAQPTDLIGARAGQAENSLRARGYEFDHSSGGDQYWWNSRGRECISLYVDNGRYQEIRRRPTSECNVNGRDDRKKDNTGAVVAGALAIGILAAAAASSKNKHNNDRYDGYRDARPYSPAKHVDCYPAQRACYERGRGYSAYWTNREFRNRY